MSISSLAPVSKSRPLAITLITALFSLLMVATFFGNPTAANAANVAIEQCNYTANTGGLNVECDVDVVNNLDLATGETSSTVSVRVCSGAAGAAPTCTNNTLPSGDLVTSVDQCNNSANGGGATLECHVNIINNITGVGSTEEISINQCNGTGAEGTEPTTICDPASRSDTNATIDQCNGSANGGGAQFRVDCDVLPSTQTSAIALTVKQCNDSANGGGSLVTCSTQITNLFLPPVVVVVPPVVVPPVVVPPVVPPVVVPPVVVPPVVTPPVVTPPVVVPPVVVPPVVTPPIVTPPAGTPPTDNTPPTVKTPPTDNTPPTTRLPKTGAEDMTPLLGFGSLVMVAGIALLLVARRKAALLEPVEIDKN